MAVVRPSLACIEPLFFGRLVGIPTSLFEDICTLDFIARPSDYVAQKDALAESLRVLPYYDPIFISKDRRTDPDVVLEGYSALYHTDRFAGAISISDVLTGEDGTIAFGENEVVADSVTLNLNNIPLRSVTMEATVPWDQTNQGSVDLTEYIYSNWPNQEAGKRYISTYTPDGIVSGWPDLNGGTQVGNGWEGAAGACSIELSTKYESDNGQPVLHDQDKYGTGNEGQYRSGLANAYNDAGDEVSIQDSVSTTAVNHGDWSGAGFGNYPAGAAVIASENNPSYDDEHDLTRSVPPWR